MDAAWRSLSGSGMSCLTLEPDGELQMLEWNGPTERWTKKFISQNIWRFTLHEYSDLVQEAHVVFLKITQRYTEESVRWKYPQQVDSLGFDKFVIKCQMAAYMFSLRNRFHDLAKENSSRIWKARQLQPGYSRQIAQQDVDEDPDDFVNVADQHDYMGELFLQLDLERNTNMNKLLASSSWDDGKKRIRRCITRSDGTRETTNEMLVRLAGVRPSINMRRTVRQFLA